MATKISTISATKKMINGFFEEGIWNDEDSTSYLIAGKDYYGNYKQYQVWTSGALIKYKTGEYVEEGDEIMMDDDRSFKFMGTFEVVDIFVERPVKGFTQRICQ